MLTAAKPADSLSGLVPRVWEGGGGGGRGGGGGQHAAARAPLPPLTSHSPTAPLLYWCGTMGLPAAQIYRLAKWKRSLT